MKEERKLSEITAVLVDHVKKLRVLADEASQFEGRLIAAIGNLGSLDPESDITDRLPVNQGSKTQAIIEFRNKSKTGVSAVPERSRHYMKPLFPSGSEGAKGGFSNIISFPGPFQHIAYNTTGAASRETNKFGEKQPLFRGPIMAIPGKPIHPEVPDFRPVLQRDGLILLAWDKRINERGERYTAYWVTSTGIPRYYASRPYQQEDFSFARPDHKSYAAEDGIEFYGQEAPLYLVHVAPELMMSNPLHGELRLTHIETLKYHGNDADFDYKYLLTKERGRDLPFTKTKNKEDNQAGA